MITEGDIIRALEAVAPLDLQESYDNSGIQIADSSRPCTGVLLCVDLTEDILREAIQKGCNLIITHHPLMFRPVKSLQQRNRVEQTLVNAIRAGIDVYSCHTSIDNAPDVGVSHTMASMLGLRNVRTLVPVNDAGAGSGAVGDLSAPLTYREVVSKIKSTFGSPVARCHPAPDNTTVSRIALCGGAGADFMTDAIAAGAQLYLTSDCKHNHFLDLTDRIFLVDIGHFESEECTKQIFYQIISEKFPNFAVYKSEIEKNPITYC
ncbi:MAG: Nif3-like dinuclear metal center hexameric protein [Muribaculaceae bacterium]|nr:Nif3-like dinuclear metal center hexameric protein [Muribaculaceae bacterium]